MTNYSNNEKVLFFRKLSREKREKMFFEKSNRLEQIKKHDLSINKNLKNEVDRLELDIKILREIELDDKSRSWND